ncbi:hypothetical protein [Nostoc sp. ChiVER01]|uniref:hypothetical protein n=1 Tax=Nostoc sp. ChiVER01 TaxID=3075382 RepID=UPI002AD54ECC|nr:hypothetical protein [Nostoc sp. ChiVER01]MDZ8223706.1 hypothetical protein [Nostoc sp. ChiVER01]
MAYSIHKAKNAQEIKEREYGIADQMIKFTKFTSCLGIVAINNEGKLIGIHLSVVDENGDAFSPTVVPLVTSLVRSDPRKVVFVGHNYLWEENLPVAYNELKNALQPSDTTDGEDGTYQAVIENGEIIVNRI